MRIARWRWVMVPMVVVIVGCLPSANPELPRSFTMRLRSGGQAFEVAQPPTDVIAASALMAQLAREGTPVPMQHSRGVPVFGILSCTGEVMPCTPGPFEGDGPTSRPVWLVIYPELRIAGVDFPDVGWLLIDAVDGLADGLWVHRDRVH